jgi:hypothetical protein
MRLASIPAAVAVLALALTPALAQQKKPQVRAVEPPPPYVQPYAQPYVPPWAGRPASDPSFSNRIGIDNERASGRCVVDLGYGRYEPCD